MVEDVKEWAIKSPNIYYVGAGVLVFAIAFIACICCCCQRCCCPSGSKVRQDKSIKMEEKRSVELAKTQIKVKDVLNEQGTCEDIDEDIGLPSQRRLISQETEMNDQIPVAIHQVLSDPEQERIDR